MKRIALLLTTVLAYGTLQAQIPNAGFEQWSGGVPAGWYSSSAAIPGTIQQFSTAHGGSWAAKGNVVLFSGFSVPPFLNAGTNGLGFPVTQRHANLTGYYQFTSVSSDIFLATVGMLQAGQTIGAGSFIGSVTQTTYMPFNIPIYYGVGGNPDTCYIQFWIADSSSGLVNAGSYFLVDDLAFVGVTVVDDVSEVPGRFSLDQNYPNPFNPTTAISYQLTANSFVTLKVYDILGREVATLVNEAKEPGTYRVQFDGSGMASGMYFYRLHAGEFVATKKLVVMK